MIVRLLSIAALLWLLGFALFVVTIPPREPSAARTDAVVVVTGGPGRVDEGFRILRAGLARRMLISGVDRRVRPIDLAAEYAQPHGLIACCVDLGQDAVDTRTNAAETVMWLAAHRYRSVRLVTTDWHMPRARYELGRALPPGIALLPDPVASEPGLPTLVTEYNKYLLRRAAAPLGY